MTPKKTIFISWFPLYYGLAFFKHIIAAFYSSKVTTDKFIFAENLEQEDFENIFYEYKNGFMFDKIYILTPDDELYKKTTSQLKRWHRQKIEVYDDALKNSPTYKIWSEVLFNKKFKSVKEVMDYVNKKFPERFDIFKKEYWRFVHHLLPSWQIEWLLNYSNLPEDYKKRFNFLKIKLEELPEHRDIEKISKIVLKNMSKITSKTKNANYLINTNLQTSHYTIAWFVLANAGMLPPNTRFIESLDIKNSRPDKRFQAFYIKEQPVNIISELTDKVRIYEEPKSKKRKIVEKTFRTYIKQGFAILILGERGTGKSYIAEKYAKQNDIKFISANCASFIDSQIAESELFGYEKGAFTGATQTKKGLIEEANGGILFMDEIHTLPKDIQFKLMRAFATDEQNRMTIRRLGGTSEIKIKLKALVFASNRSIDELRKILLPDFYDRVVQLVIELPPLRKTPEEIIPAFQDIWTQLKFDELGIEFPKKDKQLTSWIQKLPLYGNYRDIQRIAMNYKAFLQFPQNLKKELQYSSAYDFTRKQFEIYMHNKQDSEEKYFHYDLTTEEIITNFKKDLANWAIKEFGSAAKAVEHFKTLGEKITKETLYNWRNKK